MKLYLLGLIYVVTLLTMSIIVSAPMLILYLNEFYISTVLFFVLTTPLCGIVLAKFMLWLGERMEL